MNIYYLINANDIEIAKQYAPIKGMPNQLFQYIVSKDSNKTIIQADWIDTTWLDQNAIYLGKLLEDGSAEQSVYEELAKPEW